MIVCPECREELKRDAGGFACGRCGRRCPEEGGVTDFTPLSGEVPDEFKEEFFEEFFRREEKHFWHVGRRNVIYRLVRKYLRPGGRMIEIGCGCGTVISYLHRRGVDIEGADIFQGAIGFAKTKTPTRFYRADLKHFPFEREFDAAGLFDVLEHFDDDGQALKNVRDSLTDGGLLFITVPARKILWSNYDEYFCHRRRYEKKELDTLLQGAGFEPLKISFFMFFLFPAIYLSRRLLPQFRIGSSTMKTYEAVRIMPVVNQAFTVLMLLESFLISYLNFPFGSSLAAVAKKK